MYLPTLIIFTALASSCLANVVSFQSCGPEPEKPICTIKEVRVDPCPEATEGEPCKLKKSKNASIAIDFTPEFKADTMKTRAYWAAVLDVPLVGMDTEACKYLECPIKEGQVNTYSYDLHIQKSFPSQRYDVKWKLWNESKKEDMCCFVFKIKVY